VVDSRRQEETLSVLALMALKADALFSYDERGRMVGSNEPDPVRAPRLFLGRTAEGSVWRVRDDLPDEMVAEIGHILADEPALGEPQQRPASFAALCDLLTREAPVAEIWEGPAYHFPPTIPEPDGVVAIDGGNVFLLEPHFPDTVAYMGEREPYAVVVEDDVAIAACFSARSAAEAAEAGVHTEEPFRGRGYAGMVTAAWANAIRAQGRVPIYSTSWDNLASQAVARKLGLRLFGAEMSLT
jgi:RimJ/RimL family protein N-acetyltransferase